MTHIPRPYVLILVLWAALTGVALAQTGQAQYLPPHPDPLVIFSNQGVKKAHIEIEIAATAEQQQQGLMHRPPLPANTGMLFPYATPRPLSFWMHNTPASLDIIFIGSDLRILRIHAQTTPLSQMIYASDGPSLGALELAAGEAARLGLVPGDVIRHPVWPLN